MRLLNSIEDVLGQPSRLKILRFLIQSNSEMTGREIAKAIKMSHVNSHVVLKELTNIGILTGRKSGNAMLYKADRKHVLYPLLKSLFDFENNIFISLSKTIIKSLKTKPFSIILFGSQIKSNARPDSDIDILVVSRHKISDNLFENLTNTVLEAFGNQISPIFITKTDFKNKYLSKDPLILEIANAGKVIYGSTISELL